MRGYSTVKVDNSRIAGFYLLKGTAFTSDACLVLYILRKQVLLVDNTQIWLFNHAY